MTTLQIRVQTCLQTILDLQPAMRKIYRSSFADDFGRLQLYASQVNNMTLNEEDVCWIESMTSDFIKEMGFSMIHPIVPPRQAQ